MPQGSVHRSIAWPGRLAVALALAACVDQGPGMPSETGMTAVRGPFANAVQTCSATAPGPSSCAAISLTFSTYAPDDHFGGDFQSHPGSGASAPITITFSSFVSSVTIRVEDPTWSGNVVQALNASGGVLQTANVTGNQSPGTNVPQTVTLSAVGIKGLALIPAANDYVSYGGLTFQALDTCTVFDNPGEVTDPLLLDPAVQNVMRELAELTNWDEPLRNQVEQGGYFGRSNTTGEIRFFPYDQAGAGIPPGPCLSGTTTHQRDVEIPAAGFTIVGQVHTHPKAPYSAPDPGNCWTIDPRARPPLVLQKPDNSGRISFPRRPSRFDTEAWRRNPPPPYPGYMIDPERIYRWEHDGSRFRQRNFRTNSCVATGA